jgi:chitosanase
MRSAFFRVACLVFLFGGCRLTSARQNNYRRYASSSAEAAVAKFNQPNTGTPLSEFSASAGLPVAKLAAAAKKAKKVGQKYQISQGSKTYSTIFTDWANFKNVSVSNSENHMILFMYSPGFSLRVDRRYGYRLRWDRL